MALGSYVTKFTDKLDKIIERETLTSDLNMNGDLLGELSGAGEIKVAKIAMDGLANYGKASGFVAGSVTTDWETMKLAYDRGREFEVDALDDEERAALLSANLMSEFERTKVIPEVDAVRFSKLAANAGEAVAADLTTADATYKAVAAAEEALEDLGADLSRCILYCTSAVKRADGARPSASTTAPSSTSQRKGLCWLMPCPELLTTRYPASDSISRPTSDSCGTVLRTRGRTRSSSPSARTPSGKPGPS